MQHYLRESREFQNVYRHGQRYDGRFITVFVRANSSSHHRLGVTASRKTIGNAVRRNRVKRLIRESFRFNLSSLSSLAGRYDWVVNARARLLNEKVHRPAQELAEIIAKVESQEDTRGS